MLPETHKSLIEIAFKLLNTECNLSPKTHREFKILNSFREKNADLALQLRMALEVEESERVYTLTHETLIDLFRQVEALVDPSPTSIDRYNLIINKNLNPS